MDLILPIIFVVFIFLVCSVCGWCCKRNKEGTVYGFSGNPAVTVTTTYPGATGGPPYPVGAQHPMPQAIPTPMAPGFTNSSYQGAPYPTTTSDAYPVPPVFAGYYPPNAPPPGLATGPYDPSYQPNRGGPYGPTSGPYPPPGGAYPPGGGAYPPGGQYPPGGGAYPPGGGAYPPGGGAAPYPGPYPPAGGGGPYSAHMPPSYNEVVGPTPPNTDGYGKQSAYNPSY